MKTLESIYYESLPYAYAGLAIFAFSQRDTSHVATAAAVTLAYCSYFVFQQRYKYRHKYQGRKRF